MADEFLKSEIRAADIILGGAGFGEDATLISVRRTESGYAGVARWSDGEEFNFSNDDELDDLQLWALGLLCKNVA